MKNSFQTVEIISNSEAWNSYQSQSHCSELNNVRNNFHNKGNLQLKKQHQKFIAYVKLTQAETLEEKNYSFQFRR